MRQGRKRAGPPVAAFFAPLPQGQRWRESLVLPYPLRQVGMRVAARVLTRRRGLKERLGTGATTTRPGPAPRTSLRPCRAPPWVLAGSPGRG